MGFTTHFLLHSQTTRLAEGAPCSGQAGADGVLTHSDAPFQGTWAPVPAGGASIDHNSRAAGAGDSRLGLIPVRSPLLGESWLVSFPPLIDMLKFSGCSCLNSGRWMRGCLLGSPVLQAGPKGRRERHHHRCRSAERRAACSSANPLCGHRGKARSHRPPGLRPGVGEGVETTLRQACPRQKPRAPSAFKDSMIHGILQFTSGIAFRCVLHRCGSRDIRC